MGSECDSLMCPDGQVCIINDMGDEECKQADTAFSGYSSGSASSTGDVAATSTHNVVVSVVGAVGLIGLIAVVIASCVYCGRRASKEGAGSIDLGLTIAEVNCEDSVGSGRASAKYGMVTQSEVDGEDDGEELMSDHDDDLLGNHSEMIQLAMPANEETAGSITGHAMEEEL